MKIADLRVQTTPPDAPSANVVGLYANASGQVVTINSDGLVSSLGASAFLNGSNASYIGTGSIPGALVTGGAVGTVRTGVIFGESVANQVGMGQPFRWLPVIGASGERLAIPAYRYI